MSVVSTINNTKNYGEHRSWIDVDGGRYGDLSLSFSSSLSI